MAGTLHGDGQKENEGEISGPDPAWTTGPFAEAANTRQKPVRVGRGEMRPSSVSGKLSFRYFLDY